MLAACPRLLRACRCLALSFARLDLNFFCDVGAGARLAVGRLGLPTLGCHLVLIQLAEVFVAIETGDRMLLEGARPAHVLYEANHCLVADRIELGFGLVVDFLNKLGHLLEVSLEWIACHVLLYLILEVGEEAKVVVKLNMQGLIVVCHPPAHDSLAVAVLKISTFAEACLGRIVCMDQHLPCVFVLERESVVAAQDLHAIRERVRAQLLGLEEIHELGVSRYVECPPLVVYLLAQAVHGLVCSHQVRH